MQVDDYIQIEFNSLISVSVQKSTQFISVCSNSRKYIQTWSSRRQASTSFRI